MPQADGSDPPNDPFDLARFVAAQAPVYGRVVAELQAGRKESHWMWFIFPQAEGLGRSAMSVRYAIRSADEARAYLAHPILGPRYRECVALGGSGAQEGRDAGGDFRRGRCDEVWEQQGGDGVVIIPLILAKAGP
jgi:hypothetical protein